MGGAAFCGMGRREDVVGRLRADIRDDAARSEAISIALVGSVARGDDGAGSDYDFLVDFSEGVTLFDIGGLKADLEDLLGAEVDVVPRNGLRDRCAGMLSDAIPLWAAATPSGPRTMRSRATRATASPFGSTLQGGA